MIGLPITAVDTTRDIPLYHQIEADLRRLIRQGVFTVDQQLPPELELSQLYGVARQTMRLALARLVADDLIERQAGRGTFIKPQEGRMDFYLDRSFTRQMADMGLAARSQVLSHSVSIIDETMPAPLQSHLAEPYLHLARLRLGNNEPIGLQISRIVLTLCPDLETRDFNDTSLYQTLADAYQIHIYRIDHRISATAADDLQAGFLQVAVGAPLLVVHTTAYLLDGNVIEDTTSYYRADKYEYHTSHKYIAREGGGEETR
jgi:DNA-binding GntR family transcriptional regulator